MKATTGEILSVNEIHERKPNTVKNFGFNHLFWTIKTVNGPFYSEFYYCEICPESAHARLEVIGMIKRRGQPIWFVLVLCSQIPDL